MIRLYLTRIDYKKMNGFEHIIKLCKLVGQFAETYSILELGAIECSQKMNR